MTIEYCGCRVQREWRCTECGYIWQTEHWGESTDPVYTYPPCPNCGDE